MDHRVALSFLRNFHPVIHSGYTDLHSHQQCRTVLYTTFVICRYFNDGHSDQCEAILTSL